MRMRVDESEAGSDLCRECGYPLVGLPDDGVCPECATSVEVSRRVRTLADASPGYLRRLRWGTALIVLGGFVLIAGSVAGAFLLPPLLGRLVPSLATGVMLWTGAWWLTTPNPAIGDDARLLRWVAFGLLVVWAAGRVGPVVGLVGPADIVSAAAWLGLSAVVCRVASRVLAASPSDRLLRLRFRSIEWHLIALAFAMLAHPLLALVISPSVSQLTGGLIAVWLLISVLRFFSALPAMERVLAGYEEASVGSGAIERAIEDWREETAGRE